MSYRVRNAHHDLTNAMQILRHQTRANESAIELMANGGTVTKESVRATLKLQIDQTNSAYERLETALGSLDAFLKEA